MVCVEPTGLDELYEGIVLIAAVVGADPTPLLTEMQDAIAETAAAVPADMEPVRVYFALSFGEERRFQRRKRHVHRRTDRHGGRRERGRRFRVRLADVQP